ncbi:MAG: altronate dehydratase [Flavobacteriaceae bacterium]|nr:altronate dehydratase [Flavobacteriaceae bacterium]
MQNKTLKINSSDNVAVALVDLEPGELILTDNTEVKIISKVKAKHKFALQSFAVGEKIIMYDVLVGKATKTIKKGEILTTDNVKHESESIKPKTTDFEWTPPKVDHLKNKTFSGYHREDGQVGTDNVWLFFPLVFCENRNIEILKEIFEKELLKQHTSTHQLLLRSLVNNEFGDNKELESQDKDAVFGNIKVKFITHEGGCGAIRQDAESLAKLLAGYVNNPNVAGATVLSLGCQNLQIDMFNNALQKINPNLKKPVLIYEQQKLETIELMLQMVIKDSFVEIKKANNIQRKPTPISELKIGLECGGSDGFSGISANPVLGQVSDILVALGGTAVLAEFPELCGVEQEIINRCVRDADAEKFLHLMHEFETSVINAGSSFDMNPSPGNIKDGLITDAMKSAGAAKKGGTSPVVSVLDYGECIEKPGLNLLCTPGNDVESTTALAGSGTNLILFTTGLGTPTGNPIAPIIKVASNSKLANTMTDIIDFDTGKIISGEKSMEEITEELLNLIIEVASGNTETKSMTLGQDDFIPWRKGVSL